MRGYMAPDSGGACTVSSRTPRIKHSTELAWEEHLFHRGTFSKKYPYKPYNNITEVVFLDKLVCQYTGKKAASHEKDGYAVSRNLTKVTKVLLRGAKIKCRQKRKVTKPFDTNILQMLTNSKTYAV